MKKEDSAQLSTAKRAYRNASEEGNRQEEARWANVIGDIFKNRGEYVEALRWFRLDYEVSVKYLPDKQLLPTCQALGEVYLRLQHFKDALIYQKKHLELAKDTDDLVEQQRATTQLGRTYHEMSLKSDDDHTSLRNAKKYFISAMKLAQTLKENPQSNKYNFLKEYIDSHNNIGMVEMDLDNLEEAEKILTKGLQICDEEEVVENDDGRTRLHHNLGNVYMELRKWDKARKHIEKDIVICKNIGHCQGEAKGYINLGELHYRVQKYEEATLCYQKAMKLAKSMDDEHALANHVDQNMEIVKEATKVMEDLKKEEQNLKKLTRNMALAKGTSGERKCLLQQNASLDRLIEKSSIIFAWKKGQALAKINLGGVLDSIGKWANALDAFSEANLISVQLSALENMHYSYMIRFDNVEEARRLQSQIEKLKQSNSDLEPLNIPKDCCSETDTEGDDVSLMNYSPKLNLSKSYGLEDLSDDDVSFPNIPSKSKGSQVTRKSSGSIKSLEASPRSMSRSICSQTFSRKRGRLVLSDNEDENDREYPQEHVATSNEFKIRHDQTNHVHEYQDISPVVSKCAMSACTPVHVEESTSSHKEKSSKLDPVTAQDFRCSKATESVHHSHFGLNGLRCNAGVSENICQKNGPSGPIFDACEDDQSCKHMIFKVEDDFVHIEPDSCKVGNKLSVEHMKVEVACLYFLKLIKENRSKGVLPIIRHLKCGGEVLDSLDALDISKDYMCGKCWIEASIDRWVPKRLVKLYVDCCNDLSEPPNLKLLKKLYSLEVSEDEIVVSDCELQDTSAAPFLNALHSHKTIALLNLSHNFLGNESMEKLKQVFMSSSQKYGGLVLDLHCNRFGPTALFQERAIELMDSWNSENRELVKLDLSSCLLTSHYVTQLQINSSWINGVLDLNLGHNPLMEQGAIALASVIKNSYCCLKVLTLTKSQLGLLGILTILQSLSDNTSIEELNLSENALPHELTDPDSTVKPKVNESQHEVNTDCSDLEVADSEDDVDEPKVKLNIHTKSKSGLDGSCLSSFENNVSKSKSTYVEEVSYAVSMAKGVRLLDLSRNGFSEKSGEILYGGWSTDSRGGLTKRHIEGSFIHLCVDPRQCCNLKPCC
ncbi:hypothetical protein LXL04_034596 [Taraxacum kok-saghyz]